jgi:hypothetical protein
MQDMPFAPLFLAKAFHVRQEEVAFRLRITPNTLRTMARDPRYERRVRIAELEAILEAMVEQEQAEELVAQASENIG